MTLPPSLVNFGGGLDDLNAEAESYVSGVGLTVAHIRDGVLDGLPLYVDGKSVPSWLIRDAIDAAEARVEADLDMLLWEREVHCVGDLDDSGLDLDDDRVICAALDKPANWLAGHRNGEVHLPKGPAKRILRVTLKPYGRFARDIDIPVDPEDPNSGRVRLNKDRIRFVPGKSGYLMPAFGSLAMFQFLDGNTIPGGLEVVYRAGLSARELRQDGSKYRALVMIQSAIQALSFVQARLGGGVQKESVVTDGIQNTVELAKRDATGPLGGELRNLKSNYSDLLRAVRASRPFRMAFLG